MNIFFYPLLATVNIIIPCTTIDDTTKIEQIPVEWNLKQNLDTLLIPFPDEDAIEDTLTVDGNILLQDFDTLSISFPEMYVVEETPSVAGDTLFVTDMAADEIDKAVNLLDLSDSTIIKRMSEMRVLFDISYNSVVKTFIKLYTEKRRNLTERLLGLSEYYFPMFEAELDAAELPMELKYLPVIESALNPRAVSRAGATGLWQFMYATGKYMGLEINSFVDERRDVGASTKAAVKYLKQLYNIYNDWVLALAAYNCGPGNVNKAIRRSGGSKNYWEIYYRLPRETRNYVPGFIAVLYTFEHFQEYNLIPKATTLPKETDTIMIDKQLHLEQVANVLTISLELLRDIHPQYRRDIIPANSSKKYPLRLPVNYSLNFIDMQDSIYAYKDTVYFNPKTLAAGPVEREGFVPAGPPSKNHKAVYYTVVSGDNLGYIAQWFNVRIEHLRDWNNIYGNRIKPGQKLLIYVHSSKYNYYNEFNGLDFASKQKRIGITVEPKKDNEQNSRNLINDPNAKYLYYTVKKGDTLWDIARKYKDVTDSDLMKINQFTTGKELKPGMQIKIKRLD